MGDGIRRLLGKKGTALTAGRAGQPKLPTNALPPSASGPKQKALTNASIIYGLGAGMFYVFAFFHLADANWFNGIMLMVPASTLAYLAYRYIQ